MYDAVAQPVLGVAGELLPSMVRSLRPLKAALTPISPSAPITGAMYWLNSISPASLC